MFRRFLCIAGPSAQTMSRITPASRMLHASAVKLASSPDMTMTWSEYIKSKIGNNNPDHYVFEAGDSVLASNWPAKPCEFQNYTMVKDGEQPRGPQKAYPHLKYHMPYDTSKYRCYIIPEAYFNFLYERTGVLGPYILLWGGAVTLLSKELFIINEEIGAFLMWFICPLWIASKIGPGLDKGARELYNEKYVTLEKLQTSKTQQFSNEADALVEDEKRAEAGKEIFAAYDANVENMIEAEFRSRQEQVYQAFKRRLDYQVALQNLEEGLVQRQLVAWVKGEVNKAVKQRPHTENIADCLQALKSLAAQSRATAV